MDLLSCVVNVHNYPWTKGTDNYHDYPYVEIPRERDTVSSIIDYSEKRRRNFLSHLVTVIHVKPIYTCNN